MAKAVEENSEESTEENAEERTEDKSSLKVSFLGDFRFKVDAKGRVALPAKFRKVLSSSLIVSCDPEENCLYVFEPDSFNQWVTKLFVDRFGEYDTSNRTHVRLRTKLNANCESVDVDSAGRIVLAAKMREVVGIEKDVAVVGNDDHFEIWDAEKFDETMEDISLGVLYHI